MTNKSTFQTMNKPLLLLLALSGSCLFCRSFASEFPAPYNSESAQTKPLSPGEAAAAMRLPAGFTATVFAAEPDVQNPIAMAWDSRGRLWVAENYTYAESGRKFDLNLRDRILIFEDKDNDGHFDTRKVFSDELQMLTSIEVGLGGVWVMCSPQLLFIPDANGDDMPDAAAEIALDGLTGSPDMHHTFANGLRFGPDGWLYGRCGASSAGEVGTPETPASERIPLRGTMWRYHPRRKTVEVISSGTTNPWGHDWNEHGELFLINTVNGHLWHQFPGAHFERPHTFDPNPRAYQLIDQHADHWHFDTANGWQKSRDGAANDLGGGHAHIGMMIYQGDNFPPEYRGRLFTLNLHGRRANQEILERRSSGYIGKHGPDFLVAGDPWFRGMEISGGPDGSAFILDWSDTGECHEYSGVHRTSGRIFKISYGEPARPEIGDISRLGPAELVKLHRHANEWFTRRARIALTARSQDATATAELRKLYEKENDVIIKLRTLWSLYVVEGTSEDFLRAQLKDSNEHIRAWAIRLLSDPWPLDTVMSQRPPSRSEITPSSETLNLFIRLATADPSGLVRLTLASTLQRLRVSQRAALAAPLLARKEDAEDHNLPLLIWYGLIPLGEVDPSALAKLAVNAELPLTRKLIARRLAEDIEKNPAPLNQLLEIAATKPASFQTDILNGMAEGLNGWRKARKPDAWAMFAAKAEGTQASRVRDLNVVFGDGRALDEVKRVALNKEAPLAARKIALQTVIDSRAPDIRPMCEQLMGEQFINPVAARGLAAFDDPAVASKLVKSYRQFHASERGQLLSVLVSRPTFASALLDAVADRRIPRGEVSAFHARQIRGLNDANLTKKLATVWGELRDSSGDKQEAIAKWKARLTPASLGKADLSQGRAVFNTACASCHTLYGEGGKVGPDLTGGGRDNLDYLLENIVDPSAVVTADFRMSVVDLKDGRSLNALISAQTERTLTFKTMTETLTLERNEIAGIKESTLSLMPEGLLDSLEAEQARNLIAYLMHKSQAPLPHSERASLP